MKALSVASDSRHLMLFRVTTSLPPKHDLPKAELNETERERFLDLQAAAGDDFLVELDMLSENADDEYQHGQSAQQSESDSQEQDQNESVTTVGDLLLQYLRTEVESLLKRQAQPRANTDGQARCPFCPFRSWTAHIRARLEEHVRQYHSARHQYCASGTR